MTLQSFAGPWPLSQFLNPIHSRYSRHLMEVNEIWSRSQWPAARSKASTVFVRSDAGIVCSNPTEGMDVPVGLF
jgi:hypothetical protein